jgi:hypothetical protein
VAVRDLVAQNHPHLIPFSLAFNNATEVHRWMRGLLVESHAISISSLTADPTVLRAVHLRQNASTGNASRRSSGGVALPGAELTGTCEYDGQAALMRIYNPEFVSWDVGLIAGPPSIHIVAPIVVGRCADLPDLRAYSGVGELQYAVYPVPAAELVPLVDFVPGNAAAREQRVKEGIDATQHESTHRPDQSQACLPPAPPAVCLLKQLLCAVVGLCSVGVDFTLIAPSCVCLHSTSGLVQIHNAVVEPVTRGQSFSSFLSQLLLAWQALSAHASAPAHVGTDPQEPLSSDGTAKDADAHSSDGEDEAVSCEAAPAPLPAEPLRDSGLQACAQATEADRTLDGNANDESILDIGALLSLAADLPGTVPGLTEALPHLLAGLPSHTCERCLERDSMVHWSVEAR